MSYRRVVTQLSTFGLLFSQVACSSSSGSPSRVQTWTLETIRSRPKETKQTRRGRWRYGFLGEC